MQKILLFLLPIILCWGCKAASQNPNLSNKSPNPVIGKAIDLPVQRVEPVNWYVGMRNPNVQLLVYGKNIQKAQVTINYAGVTLKKVNTVENPNYLFLDIEIAKETKPGNMPIVFSNVRAKPFQVLYSLLPKSHIVSPVTPADFMYLVMPDRFANGDETNDKFADMTDTQCDPKNPYFRHGGDLKGVINHLDYMQELGVTALWLNPVIENDEPLMNEGSKEKPRMQAGFHGYHFTDHYKIDRRFGGNAAYKQLSTELHKRGMKLIQDAIYNHVSEAHWFFKDKPMKDWFNEWSAYTNTSHKEQVLSDPNGAESDKKVFTDGWFTPFLPDLNQRNPYLATYLTQHAIWSTEFFGLDAWRIDTYKYNDLDYMNRCNAAILNEYPNMLIFGETWVNQPSTLAYYTRNHYSNLPLQCNLPSTCDFPSYNAIASALNENFGWDEGVSKLHQVLAQDFLYEDPSKLVVFLENHDTNRFFSVIGEDVEKFKSGVAWLLTTRGIPQFYYGTEFLMKNFKNPDDSAVRENFSGGFKGDAANKFVATGRNQQENEAFNYVKKLANYRKNTPALQTGKLTQFIPTDGIYTYFRKNDNKTIMVVMNMNKDAKTLDTARFADLTKGFSKAKNIVSDATLNDIKTLKLGRYETMVLELGN
jgi:glycosidase